MQLDHVSFASGPEGLEAAADRFAELLQITPYRGGVHPRFGTQNLIFPLTDSRYLEVVESLEHPATLSTPFGQAVRARSLLGGGWLGWCVRVRDLEAVEKTLDRKAVDGYRSPDGGEEIHWKQIGVKGLLADPQLPYFIHWVSPEKFHPSHRIAKQPVAVTSLQIAGSRDRLRQWLNTDDPKPIPDVGIDWVAPNGTPGLMSVTFETPQGPVVI